MHCANFACSASHEWPGTMVIRGVCSCEDAAIKQKLPNAVSMEFRPISQGGATGFAAQYTLYQTLSQRSWVAVSFHLSIFMLRTERERESVCVCMSVRVWVCEYCISVRLYTSVMFISYFGRLRSSTFKQRH